MTHSPLGHNFSYYRKGSAASLMTAADVPHELVSVSKFLHVSGISQAISATAATAVDHAISMANEAGVKISYDTNFRVRLWSAAEARPTVEQTAASAHVLKTSVEDARELLGLTDPAAHRRSLSGVWAARLSS